MSEAVTVSRLTSTVSEESLAGDRQTGRQTDRHTQAGRQTDTHTETHTGRQTDRHTQRHTQTHRHTNTQMHTLTHTHTHARARARTPPGLHTHTLGVIYVKICEVIYDFANKKMTLISTRKAQQSIKEDLKKTHHPE